MASARPGCPLFDQYQVDLVLSGHDPDYERSFPVRGATSTPQGTSVWGSGGTWGGGSGWLANVYYDGTTPGAWKTKAATAGAQVNTLTPNPVTSSTTGPYDTHYLLPHQPAALGFPDYTELDPPEQFEITRTRSDGPSSALPEFPVPGALLAGTAALGAGALYLHQRQRADAELELASGGN